jgi:hypothetical protein
MATDFEAEGLLEDVEGEEAREARLELLRRLEDDGVELDELREATEEGRLVLLPIERGLAGKGERYTRAELAERADIDAELLARIWRALGIRGPSTMKT